HHRHRHSSKKHHSSSSHHSSSHSSSKSKKKKKSLPTAIKIAIIILLVLILAFGTVLGTFLVLKNMGKKDIMPVVTEQTKYEEIIEYNGHKYKYNENIVSFAFEGIDVRTLQTVDETDFIGACDANIVVAIDTETGKTNAIVIPRDTMVDVDMYSAKTGLLLKSDKTQLCLAYAYGDGAELSCQNTVDAMSRILNNVPINKYFALDLDGIAPLNDAIGGVEISNSLYAFPDEGINIGDPVTLKGDMAEKYVRTRDVDYIEASLNRTERQMQYVRAYANQALPAVVRDFSTVSKLYNIAKNYSRTNLTLSNATYMASLLLSKNIRDFDTVMLKGEMKSSPAKDLAFKDFVYAEFYPDEDFLMQSVLNAFYTQIE
ncbi:MAG: LCP family protein, partial [Eubacterium sp.]|nr:LCP family protein [Eubacterium sp.]